MGLYIAQAENPSPGQTSPRTDIPQADTPLGQTSPETALTRAFLLVTGRNEVLAKVMFLQASVILSTGGGGRVSKLSGGASSKFSGGFLQIFFGGFPPNLGGSSKFSGGVPPNFRGRGSSKFSGGGGVSTRIRSTFGRYASYWNAFLFLIIVSHCSNKIIK